MGCSHSENVTIVEYGTMTSEHALEKGKWFNWHDVGGYSGKMEVNCHTCGLCKVFYKYSKRNPKWLKKLLKEAEEATNGD